MGIFLSRNGSANCVIYDYDRHRHPKYILWSDCLKSFEKNSPLYNNKIGINTIDPKQLYVAAWLNQKTASYPDSRLMFMAHYPTLFPQILFQPTGDVHAFMYNVDNA